MLAILVVGSREDTVVVIKAVMVADKVTMAMDSKQE